MIKKIICPTDFSKASINAAEYAAKLAKIFDAELLFVNVQRIPQVVAAVSIGGGVGANKRDNVVMIAKKLEQMSIEANKMFKISTDYEVDITTASLVKIISDIGADKTLVVMGTNGAEDIEQYLFGTNTYQVIEKANSPVLVVHENVPYGSIKKIVFAWDYSSKSKFSFSLLSDFRKAFDPKFVFLHVSKHHTEISKDVFRALRSEITAVLGDGKNVEFEQLFSDDIPESINAYMLESKADMLSITYYNRGFINNIFHGTVTKELTQTEVYPVLVLHA
ncbi:MAG: hypothetical protein A3F72_10680 [Bacteroidetes bacterium RIFCSPLOWO2_12_FULL_35_15]|nr:MAG: hypothetical protein A3F72_10680 [Bacteroidetes bacterium RIFCSPLOWO2_12_FULL_35_15]